MFRHTDHSIILMQLQWRYSYCIVWYIMFLYIQKKLSYSRVIEILRIVSRVAKVYFWVNISFLKFLCMFVVCGQKWQNSFSYFTTLRIFVWPSLWMKYFHYLFFRVYIFIAQLLHLTRVYMANEFVCFLRWKAINLSFHSIHHCLILP